MGLPSYLLNLISDSRQKKADNQAIHSMLLGMQQAGPTADGSPNYGANSGLVKQVRALQEAKRPGMGLELLLNSTSPEAKRQREADALSLKLLGAQTEGAESTADLNALNLERAQNGYVSPADQSLIDYRNAQITDMNRGPTQAEQEMTAMQLEEQRLKTLAAQQQNQERDRKAREQKEQSIRGSFSSILDANAALSNVKDLLQDNAYKRIYGVGDQFIPTILPGGVELEQKRDQLIGLLSLNSRQKLKGQGTITDTETKMLEQSATILGNPGISESAAQAEIKRVEGIFRNAKEREARKIHEGLLRGEINPKELTRDEAQLMAEYIRSLEGSGVE